MGALFAQKLESSTSDLHSRYPVYNLDTFVGKRASRARDDDVEEEA